MKIYSRSKLVSPVEFYRYEWRPKENRKESSIQREENFFELRFTSRPFETIVQRKEKNESEMQNHFAFVFDRFLKKTEEEKRLIQR